MAFIILTATAKMASKKAVSIYTCIEAYASTLVILYRLKHFIFIHLVVEKQMASRRCFNLHCPIPREAEHPLPIFLLGFLLF